MARKECKFGFTLVELSFSILFISALLLMIVLTINNTTMAYQRGLKLSRINSVGSNIVDDMRSSVQSSSARSLTRACDNFSLSADCMSSRVLVRKTESRAKADGGIVEVPVYGAFCTGTYSYIWNSGYFQISEAEGGFSEPNNYAKLRYKEDDGNVAETGFFKLIKIQDEARLVCSSYKATENVFDVSETWNRRFDEKESKILSDNNDLALFDLSVAAPAASKSGDNIFYSVSFILGTTSGGVNVLSSGSGCVAPQDSSGSFSNYCSINKFSFAVQVNGG